jgi:nifR3 family TIM-barrel protein
MSRPASAAAAAPAARFASPENRDVPVAAPGELRPLALGPLAIWPPVVLAPMAGVTNYPFRALCRDHGAGLYVSEMITARGWLHGNRMTRLLASSRPDESPRSVQIYGTEPASVRAMARGLADEGVDHLDMNFGCPVRKVTRAGGGSAIPVKPRLFARIVRAAVEGAGDVPVTIKVRKGIDDGLLTYLESGRVAQEEGAVAIGLHARTAAQLYAGEADWDAIARLVDHVSIPVLGNGDVWEAWDALRMMRATGCAGVIVGRGCLGRPWLFRELAQAFDGREPDPPPSLGGVVAVLLEHARRLIDFFGEEQGVRQMRKWCTWYTVGFRGSSQARARLVRAMSLDEIRAVLGELDADEPFPLAALRAHRAKGGRTQRVSLPEGYLDARDDDASPCEAGAAPPEDAGSGADDDAWDDAVSGG